jgi:two-component system, OmpR family, KDP operon response regulator KdpE
MLGSRANLSTKRLLISSWRANSLVSKMTAKTNDRDILVVAHDPQIRRVLRPTFEANGYEMEEASSGEEALERCREKKFDLVLLDNILPGMTALDTCKNLYAIARAPVIVSTARATDQEIIEALDAGAHACVAKPFAMGELLARMRAVLRRTTLPVPGTTPLRLGKFEINFVTRKAALKGEPIHMPPREFDLLLYFASHPNRIIPRVELLQEVWSPAHVNEAKLLRVFINRLRKKIEGSAGEPKFLLTEPFVGYRLEIPK